MPTEIVLNENDDVFHEKHPDKGDQTFCGIVFNRDNIERLASFARYADDVRAQVAAEEEKDFCRDCEAASDEWADDE